MPVLAFYPQASADSFGQSSTQIKAQSSTADFASVAIVDTVEFLEKMPNVLWRYADTGVSNTNGYLVVVAGDVNGDVS